jgi:hypothetical protein
MLIIALCGLGGVAPAQLNQSHPELCGGGGGGTLPAGLSAASGNGAEEGETVLTLRNAESERRVVLDEPGPLDQICVLRDGELIAFDEPGDGNYHIARIDSATMRQIDSFAGKNPAISPDAHWLIMRAFSHFAAPADEQSEEYLLYDLTADAKTNAAGLTPYTASLVGRPVYPVPSDGVAFESQGLPPEQTHSFRSQRFYWDADSREVVFADSVQDRLSLVAILPGYGKAHALVHPIAVTEVCQNSSDAGSGLTLSGVFFGPPQGSDHAITAYWNTAGGCLPQELTLHLVDFTNPVPEVHIPPIRRPAVLNGVTQ